MSRALYHVVLPAVVPLVFFAVAATPVDLLGCRGRGLLALLIALIGVFASLGAVILGLIRKMKRDPNAAWWIASGLILAIPAVFVVLIAR